MAEAGGGRVEGLGGVGVGGFEVIAGGGDEVVET